MEGQRPRVVVIGGGPAGLTAAYRLAQSDVFERVDVLEASEQVGGRTRSMHFAPGHHTDTGAGWLATFYRNTLDLFREVGFIPKDQHVGDSSQGLLRPRTVRGASDLLIDGKEKVPLPFSLDALRGEPGERVFGAHTEERRRVIEYFEATARDENGAEGPRLEIDLRHDAQSAAEAFRDSCGAIAVERVFRPMFENPFFTRIEDMSAAMARSWLRALLEPGMRFFQVKGGMDAPWIRLAEQVLPSFERTKVRVLCNRRATSVGVRRAQSPNFPLSFRVSVASSGSADDAACVYDAVVVAVPAPAASAIVKAMTFDSVDDDAEFAELRRHLDQDLAWMHAVRYSAQVRVYASRHCDEDVDHGYHLVPAPVLNAVEYCSGRHGAWGECPADHQWALLCCNADESARHLASLESGAATKEDIAREIWDYARRVLPELFAFDAADHMELLGWKWGVPVCPSGHFERAARYRRSQQRRATVVLAGDWLCNACVEGAVRSGEAAARALLLAAERAAQ